MVAARAATPERIAFMPRLIEPTPVADPPPAPAVEVPRASQPAPAVPKIGPALRLEVFDLVGTVVEGDEAEYVVRVTNQGQTTAEELQIWANASPELKPLGVTGQPDAAILDQAVQLSKLDLPPGEARSYRLRLQGVRSGDARVKVGLIAKDLAGPVVEEESTTVMQP